MKLENSKHQALADVLGDTPYTVIFTDSLRRSLCNAYITGAVEKPEAVIIQPYCSIEEPVGFGADPEKLWNLLMTVNDWECFLVDAEIADDVAALMHSYTGRRVGFIHDLNFRMIHPVERFFDPNVRLLTSADATLLAEGMPLVVGVECQDPLDFLSQSVIAAAIVDGRIVSIARTTAQSDKYADIGVDTLEPFRRRGFAQAAASLVAAAVQEIGKTPVWSAGHFNEASLSIAGQLGFSEIPKRTYVITDRVSGWSLAQQPQSSGK